MEVTDYIFPTELHQLRSFIEKHDRVTDQLEILAAKDDFLTGTMCTMYGYIHIHVLTQSRQVAQFVKLSSVKVLLPAHIAYSVHILHLQLQCTRGM